MAILAYNETGKQAFKLVEKPQRGDQNNPSRHFIGLVSLQGSLKIDINLGTYEESIHANEISESSFEYIESFIKTSVVYPHRTQIKYSRKKLTPYMCGTRRINREIIMVSLNLEGRKLTSFYNKKALVYLADFEQGKHLNFVASVPTLDSQITVTTQDEATGMVYFYRLVYNEEKDTIFVFKREVHVDNIPEKGEKGYVNINDFVDTKPNYKISTYTPARPSYMILVEEDKAESLVTLIEEVYKWNENRYVLNTFNTEVGLEKIVKNMQIDYYDVVTVHIDLPYEQAKEEKQTLLGTLASSFNIVLVIDITGRTYKYKI